jgi:phage terminase small subunit
LEAIAAGDPVMRGLLIKSPRSGKAQRNPLVKIAADAAADMIRYAGEFGLTAVVRTRLAQGIQSQEKSKFEGLIATPFNGPTED